MQAMTILYDAWAASTVPPPPSTPRLLSQPGWPADLRIRTIGRDADVILVSFSLGPLTGLTRAELEVARLANAGHANAVIARERRTSMHTVARQMSSVVCKLGIGSRLGLATIAELGVRERRRRGARGARSGVPVFLRRRRQRQDVGDDLRRELRRVSLRQQHELDAGGGVGVPIPVVDERGPY
jgi:DNA-binding CsgD family transcriptional regulator